MKWLLRLFKKEEKLKLGDKVTSVNNFYSKGVCVITRIYDRKSSGEKIKYCRLEFEQYGFKRVINVTYKSCKKVNLNG
jgi:RNA polymerase-interacting CarD/CdnL/TRCF family regulator